MQENGSQPNHSALQSAGSAAQHRTEKSKIVPVKSYPEIEDHTVPVSKATCGLEGRISPLNSQAQYTDAHSAPPKEHCATGRQIPIRKGEDSEDEASMNLLQRDVAPSEAVAALTQEGNPSGSVTVQSASANKGNEIPRMLFEEEDVEVVCARSLEQKRRRTEAASPSAKRNQEEEDTVICAQRPQASRTMTPAHSVSVRAPQDSINVPLVSATAEPEGNALVAEGKDTVTPSYSPLPARSPFGGPPMSQQVVAGCGESRIVFATSEVHPCLINDHAVAVSKATFSLEGRISPPNPQAQYTDAHSAPPKEHCATGRQIPIRKGGDSEDEASMNLLQRDVAPSEAVAALTQEGNPSGSVTVQSASVNKGNEIPRMLFEEEDVEVVCAQQPNDELADLEGTVQNMERPEMSPLQVAQSDMEGAVEKPPQNEQPPPLAELAVEAEGKKKTGNQKKRKPAAHVRSEGDPGECVFGLGSDAAFRVEATYYCKYCAFTVCRGCFKKFMEELLESDDICPICKEVELKYTMQAGFQWQCKGPRFSDWRTKKSAAAFDERAIANYYSIKDTLLKRGKIDAPPEVRFVGCSSEDQGGHPFRGPGCVEGGTFMFTTINQGLEEELVWLAVRTAMVSSREGLTNCVSAQPIAMMMCPPSLPNIREKIFKMSVPPKCYERFGDELHLIRKSDFSSPNRTSVPLLTVKIFHTEHVDTPGYIFGPNEAIDLPTNTSSSSQLQYVDKALNLCLDFIECGRNVCFFGVGSKHAYLRYVYSCADLKHMPVHEMEAYRPKQDVNLAQALEKISETVSRLDNQHKEDFVERKQKSISVRGHFSHSMSVAGEMARRELAEQLLCSAGTPPRAQAQLEPSSVFSPNPVAPLYCAGDIPINQIGKRTPRFAPLLFRFATPDLGNLANRKRRRDIRNWAQITANQQTNFERLRHLIVVHNIDLLDAVLLAKLTNFYEAHKASVVIICSIDDPLFFAKAPKPALASLQLALIMRHTLLPQVREVSHLHGPVDTSEQKYSTAPRQLPMVETVRRVIISLPLGFRSILRLILEYQKQIGEENGANVHQLQDFMESKGNILTTGRMRSVIGELTSNRLATYEAASHSIKIQQVSMVSAILDELSEAPRTEA